jgi:hypothetical protein
MPMVLLRGVFLGPPHSPLKPFRLMQRSCSVPGPTGAAQHFEFGGDLPEQWWRVFRSSDLNKLIGEALRNNPNLQSTMSTLRATKEAVYAQQGKYFPVAQGNFFASRQQTPASLAPIPANGATVFDLYTAQVLVTYMMDVWGLNRRTVESLQAQSDMQRFTVEAAYLRRWLVEPGRAADRENPPSWFGRSVHADRPTRAVLKGRSTMGVSSESRECGRNMKTFLQRTMKHNLLHSSFFEQSEERSVVPRVLPWREFSLGERFQ